jgi:peptidoglycan hydrolase CwlO-like protein
LNDVLPIFLEHGLLGACVIVLAVVVWRLFKALAKTQNDRVAEAQAVTDKMLNVSDRFLEHVSALTSEVEKVSEKVDGVEKKIDGIAAAMQQHAVEAARKG